MSYGYRPSEAQFLSPQQESHASRHTALFPQWFRSAVVKEDAMPATLMALLFSNIDPIYEFHRGFLREVEQRLALW